MWIQIPETAEATMRQAAALFLLLSVTANAAPLNDQSALSDVEGYTPISPADIEIRRQVTPGFPRSALQAGYTHEECVVHLFIDDKGKLEDAQVQMTCPEPFHKAVLKAAKKWRFEPYASEDGQPSAVTFAVRFRFVRQD